MIYDIQLLPLGKVSIEIRLFKKLSRNLAVLTTAPSNPWINSETVSSQITVPHNDKALPNTITI